MHISRVRDSLTRYLLFYTRERCIPSGGVEPPGSLFQTSDPSESRTGFSDDTLRIPLHFVLIVGRDLPF